jgi:hypothetical protein
MELQQINSPFGFKQYLLRTFHFAKHYGELHASRFFRTPPTAVLRIKLLLVQKHKLCLSLIWLKQLAADISVEDGHKIAQIAVKSCCPTIIEDILADETGRTKKGHRIGAPFLLLGKE